MATSVEVRSDSTSVYSKSKLEPNRGWVLVEEFLNPIIAKAKQGKGEHSYYYYTPMVRLQLVVQKLLLPRVKECVEANQLSEDALAVYTTVEHLLLDVQTATFLDNGYVRALPELSWSYDSPVSELVEMIEGLSVRLSEIIDLDQELIAGSNQFDQVE